MNNAATIVPMRALRAIQECLVMMRHPSRLSAEFGRGSQRILRRVSRVAPRAPVFSVHPPWFGFDFDED
jgi:hypothetical protein